MYFVKAIFSTSCIMQNSAADNIPHKYPFDEHSYLLHLTVICATDSMMPRLLMATQV